MRKHEAPGQWAEFFSDVGTLLVALVVVCTVVALFCHPAILALVLLGAFAGAVILAIIYFFYLLFKDGLI